MDVVRWTSCSFHYVCILLLILKQNVNGVSNRLDRVFVRFNESLFFLNRGRSQLLSLNDAILEAQTVYALGGHMNTVLNISIEEFANYPLHPYSVPHVYKRDESPDELMRFHVLKARVLQRNDNLIQNITFMGNYLNPSLAVWRGRCISITTKTPAAPPIRSIATIVPLDDLCAKPMWNVDYNMSVLQPNQDAFSFVEDHKYATLSGEDPRIIVMPDNRILNVLTGGYSSHGVPKLSTALLHFNDLFHRPEFEKRYDLVKSGSHPKEGHKNWSPFVYNNTAYFIVHINPLHVVRCTETHENDGVHIMSDISIALFANVTWDSGHLRGGTPAHLINKDEYMAVFHSTKVIEAGRITFFMGAYTFSSHPPFHLIRISSVPIIHDKFYNGAWFHKKYDYIVYPMGYIFQDISGSKGIGKSGDNRIANELSELISLGSSIDSCPTNINMLLSFGYQDMESWIARINLCELLDTMVYI